MNKNNQIPEGIMGGRKTTTKESNSLLITKRNNITSLRGVNWLKQLPITIRKISLDKNRPIRNNLHKIQEPILNQPHHKIYRSENTNKARMLPDTTKSKTNTISPKR